MVSGLMYGFKKSKSCISMVLATGSERGKESLGRKKNREEDEFFV
jgi:hypothetical protein